MMYKKNEFSYQMKEWQKLLENFSFPKWDDLPSFDLYMDQVIALMNEYLKAFASPRNNQGLVMTPPMINNYVKLKVMPAPQKKKYSKIHLAYLIMISSLKQALSIPTIQKIVPLLDDKDEIKKMFESFSQNQQKAFNYITKQVTTVSDPIFEAAENNPDRMNDLAIQIAISANVFKVLTEDVAEISGQTDSN